MNESRSVLVCPNCGAPLPPGATHETVTCAFCGVASALANLRTLADRSDSICPRCEARLFFGEASSVKMLGCGLCGGVWLDNESAQRVMRRFDDAIVELAVRAGANAVKRPDVRAPAKCADCREPMQRRAVTAVEIDYCASHGTWFDAGELAIVVAPLRPAAPVMMVPAQFDSPTFVDTSTTSSSSVDWGDVAGTVIGGAFEVLGAILTN